MPSEFVFGSDITCQYKEKQCSSDAVDKKKKIVGFIIRIQIKKEFNKNMNFYNFLGKWYRKGRICVQAHCDEKLTMGIQSNGDKSDKINKMYY